MVTKLWRVHNRVTIDDSTGIIPTKCLIFDLTCDYLELRWIKAMIVISDWWLQIFSAFQDVSIIQNWLVVWLPFFDFSHQYWVSNHPNWRSYFSEGWPNHQPEKADWEDEHFFWGGDGLAQGQSPLKGYRWGNWQGHRSSTFSRGLPWNLGGLPQYEWFLMENPNKTIYNGI